MIANGVLVEGDNVGWVYALDAVTGKLRWSRNLGQPINGSAATRQPPLLYSISPPGSLVARDPSTGAQLASVCLGGIVLGGVSATGHALYVSVGTGPLPVVPVTLDGPGSIVALEDTSASAASATTRTATSPKPAV